MARGPRKTLDEKICAKQELIDSLEARLEKEQDELDDLLQERRLKELETVNDLIRENGLEPNEVTTILQEYIQNRSA